LETTLENAARLGAIIERARVFLGSSDFWFACATRKVSALVYGPLTRVG